MRLTIPALALAALAACSDPEHSSPFDPQTPPALQARAALQGTVTLEAAGATAPSLAGTTVSVPGVAVVTTDAAGSYVLQGVPEGRYTVTASRAGYDDGAVAGIVVTLDDGDQTLPVPALRLAASRGAVAGAVTLGAGAAAGFPVGADRSGVVVTLVAPDGTSRSAVTGAAGEYRFDDVPVSAAGAAHALEASKPFFLPDAGTVDVIARTVMPAPPLSLEVDAGALDGSAVLWDDVGGGGANATSAGTTVSLVGTAFNGVSWSAAGTTAADGGFTLGGLPPGSYDVLFTSDDRDCGPTARITVAPGEIAAAEPVRCEDRVAPGAVTLGAPLAPPGGVSGWAPATSVTVPVAAQATDATAPASNLRGYELVVGSAADWRLATLVEGQPSSLTFAGLAPNAANLLWARAVDWVGNAGPVSAVQVTTDGLAPPAPTISTPRPHVDATTTSVTLSGSDADAGFGGYEVCTTSQAATAACPGTAPGGCAWGATSPSFALSLASNQRTCLWARAWDRAGNRSGVSSLGAGGVVSDLVPPAPPAFVPSYDPTQLTVRAPWVDFFVSAASTDGPSGGGPWEKVAWIEVDTGSGFTPLCPAAACHPNDTYAPCGCGCADARLVCDAGQLVAVRAPLAQGTRNTVAFRAVDLAGNVGAGVSQQVDVDSSGDVVAGTAANDSSPIVRGNVLAYASFNPGAGNPHGIVVDLGANRRFDASDATCDVAPSVASGYDRGIAAVNTSLVVTAEIYAARMVRAGANGLCGAGAVTSTFRTPPAGYSVYGVSGAGEVVGWWEEDYWAPSSRLYVREGGPDGVFGTADDPVTLLATFSHATSLTVGERALLVRECATGVACQPDVWRVYNANASGSFSSGTSFVELASTVESPSISPDGRQVAWVDGAGVLAVRTPGPNGVFDAADDVTVTRAIPAAWGLSVSGYHHTLGVDGPHVMAMATGTPLGYLVHWWAGLDGAFGTADDTLARTHPSTGNWGSLSLAASLAAYEEQSDVKLVDLSTLRWEIAPASGFETNVLAADGRGNLLYKEFNAPLVARTAAGAETTGPIYRLFAAEGTSLLALDWSNDAWVHVPDAGGAWFSPTAPARVKVYTSTAASVLDLVVGGGKGMIQEYVGSNAYRFKILEPRGGTLATLPTAGAVVDALGVDQGWGWAYGVTARQAFYTCNGITSNVCVRNAGADGWFGTGDDTTTYLLHPTGSPRAPSAVHDARAFLVSGTRMLFAEFSPPALYLLDAGADKLFNTADDRGRKLADGYFDRTSIALAGRVAAYAADGSPAGRQVYLVSDFGETPAPVTAHYSSKTSLTLEPGGRAFWVDSVFAPEAVFVRAP